jgi:hypothetical protein
VPVDVGIFFVFLARPVDNPYILYVYVYNTRHTHTAHAHAHAHAHEHIDTLGAFALGKK